MSEISERLKALRVGMNLTQKQLADSIGVSVRGIQNYELNQRKPTPDILIKIADRLDVSVDYLLCRTDNPDSHKKMFSDMRAMLERLIPLMNNLETEKLLIPHYEKLLETIKAVYPDKNS